MRIADEPRLMPHLHLSLQAGDDMILKRMKRRHSRADAIALLRARCARLRPDIVFGADIIAGFPTETEDDVRALAASSSTSAGSPICTSFPISPRPGTPAARMPQVPHPAAQGARARCCARTGEAALRRHLEAQVGARRRVLTESNDIGRTEQFTPVRPRRARAGAGRRSSMLVRSPAHDGQAFARGVP